MARSSYMDMFRSSNPFEGRNNNNNWRNLASSLTSNNRGMFDRNPYGGGFSFTTFGTGILLGVGVALLLAPKSGRELRDDLSRRAGEIGENVRNRLPQMNERQNDHERYSAQGNVNRTNPAQNPTT